MGRWRKGASTPRGAPSPPKHGQCVCVWGRIEAEGGGRPGISLQGRATEEMGILLHNSQPGPPKNSWQEKGEVAGPGEALTLCSQHGGDRQGRRAVYHGGHLPDGSRGTERAKGRAGLAGKGPLGSP